MIPPWTKAELKKGRELHLAHIKRLKANIMATPKGPKRDLLIDRLDLRRRCGDRAAPLGGWPD